MMFALTECRQGERVRIAFAYGINVEMADAMLDHNVFVIGFSYPVVPKGKARIRCQVSAAHTTEQIDHSVEAFIKVGKEFGVI